MACWSRRKSSGFLGVVERLPTLTCAADELAGLTIKLPDGKLAIGKPGIF